MLRKRAIKFVGTPFGQGNFQWKATGTGLSDEATGKQYKKTVRFYHAFAMGSTAAKIKISRLSLCNQN